MSEWREENFLERLADSSAKTAGVELCPEAESLFARSDSGGNGAMSAELSQHLSDCGLCADLRQRLELFDQGRSTDLDSDGREAEKRLDAWMKGFVAAERLTPKVAATVAAEVEATVAATVAPAKVIAYQPPLKVSRVWKMQWALAAAALVIIGLGGVYIRRSIFALAPTTEMARVATEAAPVAPAQVPAQDPAQATSIAATPTPKANAAKGGVRPAGVKANSPATAPAPSTSGEQSAAVPELGTAPQTSAPQTSASETPAAETSAQAAPSVGSDSQVAAESTPAPGSSGPVRPTVPATSVALSNGKNASGGEAGAKAVCPTCASAAPAGAIPARPFAPSPIRIPAGTRIWIAIETTTPAVDGFSQFRGALLLPVTSNGAVILEKGTNVVGMTSTKQNQTTFQIKEFVVHGVAYELAAETGAVAFQGSGSGKVVGFQGGKTAEMWLNSQSTFAATKSTSGSTTKGNTP
jgi:hypothetical protein